MRLPFLASISLPSERDPLISRMEELTAEGMVHHGYLRATTGTSDRFLFFLGGKAHSAGEALGAGIVARSVGETVQNLVGIEKAVYCSTDLALLLCTAVPFRKAPAASIPLELVDPETLLKSIAGTEKDAVLVVRRGDARTLVFCERGLPRALYAAPDEAFPEGGEIPDRIVEYVLVQPDRDNITLDVYDQIRLPPSADAGGSLRSYLNVPQRFTKPRDPIWLVVKLRDRVVFHYPMTAEEIIIGRGLEADLVLDNLSVSRRHASIRRGSGFVTATDLGGANGIVVGDAKVESVDLQPGDEIRMGKYTLLYATEAPGAARVAQKQRPRLAALEQTVMIEQSARVAIEHRSQTYNVHTLMFKIGSSQSSNICISGWFVAPTHARIDLEADGSYRVLHVAGRRRVKLNGSTIDNAPIGIGDELVIAGERFVVREA